MEEDDSDEGDDRGSGSPEDRRQAVSFLSSHPSLHPIVVVSCMLTWLTFF